MRLTTVWGPVSRWGEYRRRQRLVLEASNRIDPGSILEDRPASVPPDALSSSALRFGAAGRPLNRHSPFYLGFFGATGALLAVGLWSSLGRLTTTLTILLVAFFLALALDPLVKTLTRRLPRPAAVTAVFLGLVGVLVVLGFVVVPPVASQGAALAEQAPGYVQDVLDARWVRELDSHYGVLDRLESEVTTRLTSQSFLGGVLGGILGAGRAVVSGVFQVLTVLVLTLYLLASLPRVKTAAYALVPASRRPRVESLSEEIMRRVGSYAIGQVAIASLNAALSWVMMTVVGIPYAAVLAVAVGLLGLVPMVGATLGAAVVCLVAFFDEPRKALVALVYYVVYQQLENYVVAPRVMQRTVSVPGTVTVVAVGLLGLVPMVGATLGAAVVCLVAFFDEPRKALVALVYYVVYQQLENYVVAPRVMQRTVSVPGTVTVVAALAGGALLGVLGALLAIPVAAGLLLIYEEVLVPRQREA